jgi:hypothetical protein
MLRLKKVKNVVDTTSLSDYCTATAATDMENIEPLIDGPCEYRSVAFLLHSRVHTTMWTGLWDGDEAHFVQLHKAALWLMERKLPKSREYLRYVVLRLPTKSGEFRFIGFEPDHSPLQWVEVTVSDTSSDANAMIVLENMIERIVTTIA